MRSTEAKTKMNPIQNSQRSYSCHHHIVSVSSYKSTGEKWNIQNLSKGIEVTKKNQTELKVKELKMKFFMNKNLPDLVKDEPTEQIPDRINLKSTPRHITIKFLKRKTNSLKGDLRETTLPTSAVAEQQSQRQWVSHLKSGPTGSGTTFKCSNPRTVHGEFCIQQNSVSFRKGGKTKALSDEAQLKTVTTVPTPKEWLKELSPKKGNGNWRLGIS